MEIPERVTKSGRAARFGDVLRFLYRMNNKFRVYNEGNKKWQIQCKKDPDPSTDETCAGNG